MPRLLDQARRVGSRSADSEVDHGTRPKAIWSRKNTSRTWIENNNAKKWSRRGAVDKAGFVAVLRISSPYNVRPCRLTSKGTWDRIA